jgi:hypothetical protein
VKVGALVGAGRVHRDPGKISPVLQYLSKNRGATNACFRREAPPSFPSFPKLSGEYKFEFEFEFLTLASI